MIRRRFALAPLGALFGLSFAYLFAACSGSNGPGIPDDPRDGSPDTNDGAIRDGGSDGQRDGGDGSADAGDADGGKLDGGDAGDAGPNDGGSDADAEPPLDGGGATLRIMAANLTHGNRQSYTPAPGDEPGPGGRIFQGLDPDIVLIQEFNYGTNSATDVRAFVTTNFGAEFAYYRENGAGIPNGIISRYPILEAGEWDDPEVGDRDFAWAKIDVPGNTDLWAISVHLLSSGGATERAKEARALVAFIKERVPASDYVVLGGDFNTGTRAEECVTTLGERFVTAGPYPRDQANDEDTNRNRDKPYDWVIADPRLNQLGTPLVMSILNSFPDGLVFDSRAYFPLTEVPPVKSEDSNAQNMQHMGVVRAFRLP